MEGMALAETTPYYTKPLSQKKGPEALSLKSKPLTNPKPKPFRLLGFRVVGFGVLGFRVWGLGF